MSALRVSNASGPTLDDERVKSLARRDRRAAAEALVRRYREPLLHHAYWILKDWEEAVDVTQDVFIKALREPRFYDPDFKMKAWLYRVTSNLCFNRVRDRRRRSAILETVPRTSSDGSDPIDAVFATERQEQILAAIDRLTEDHREILMLRYYSDLSYAEIGDTLKIALGTVMSRLSRARGRLLEALAAAGVDVHEAEGRA